MEYKIDLAMDVKKKRFKSTISLICDSEELVAEFLVHKNTEIDTITINGSEVEWRLEDIKLAFIHESKKLILNYNGVYNETVTEILFKIKGSIDIIKKYEINQISDDFIELNVYSPWYPITTDFREAKAEINISGIDNFYLMKGIKNNGGSWNLNFQGMDFYIIAFLKPIIKEIKFNCGAVKIISTNEDEVITIIEDSIKDILDFYNSIFNRVRNANLDIVIAPRNNGGGYCRKNLIVMTETKLSKKQYEKYLAHELSHIWFTGAEVLSWEDWLNESFAEYISLLYIEKKYGQELYKEGINKLIEYTKKCPPIINSDRNSEEGSKIRYKGTVLLHDMRKEFGLDLMYQVFNILIELKEKTTKDLITEVKEINKELGAFIEARIKE